MPLTVLSVAYPFAPVGPHAVGGAEQILGQLDAALVSAGHRSVVIACEGSQPAGELLPIALPPGPINEETRSIVYQRVSAAIAAAVGRERVDLIHMHGIDFDRYLPAPGPPVLVTLHLPLAWYAAEVWTIARPATYLHSVSQTQVHACPAHASLLPVIENGVPVPTTALTPIRLRSYALALGRICPEKNLQVALDAGRRANLPVLLAGQVFPYAEHLRYMQEEIVPRLDEERRFLGPVAGPEKHRLLAEARCLLLPTLAPETSSLVAMEALAAGTPVIAFRSGALPEIIEHGVTGLLVGDEASMAAAIREVDRLDPAACRESAARRFSFERMIDAYFATYQRIARCAGEASQETHDGGRASAA